MNKKTNLTSFEEEKKKLLKQGLSPAEYEKAVIKLCKKFKI